MEIKSLFSAFSLVATFIYIHIGFFTFSQKKKSNIHRVFLLLCTSYAVWSFAYVFAYAAYDNHVFYFWNKISAVGWCSFSAITLYLVLLITESKVIKRKIVVILIFLPSVVFLYMVLFLFGTEISISPITAKIFYIGDFLYDFLFELLSIIILSIWGLKSQSKRIKKQSNILVISSIIPLCLNLLTQNILPLVTSIELPLMGQLYAVIMIFGTYIVIIKYKFLMPKEKYMSEKVVNEMMDMVVLLNEKGEIIKVSKYILNILGYEKEELISKNISLLVGEDSSLDITADNMKQGDMKYNEINIYKRNGERVPASISCISIYDSVINDFLGTILVIQDISMLYELKRKNDELQEKAIRDSLTKLYNQQYSLELLKKESNNKELSVMMLDIDYFKEVNDTYGHQFGNYVLETISNILVSKVNDAGYVGRFGGEEFIIILPGTSMDQAGSIGEKIRSDIENYKFNKDVRITISIGIKLRRDESCSELIEGADALLYRAKHNGRNRVEYEGKQAFSERINEVRFH